MTFTRGELVFVESASHQTWAIVVKGPLEGPRGLAVYMVFLADGCISPVFTDAMTKARDFRPRTEGVLCLSAKGR